MTRPGSVLLLLSILLCGGAALADPASSESSGTDRYHIGIEDVLRVVVWGEPDLSLSVKVRHDGFITLPLINDIKVVGMTTEELRTQVTGSLAEFIREPSVTVIVEEFNSFRVFFLGEVNTQGALQFHSPTRLLQGIATAGGLTEFAKKEVVLLRDLGGVEKRLRVDYKKLLAGDPAQENIFLMPGDTLLFN